MTHPRPTSPLRQTISPRRTCLLGGAVGLLVALSACGPDTSQADLCERVVDKLYGGPGTVTVVKTETLDGQQPEVVVRFRPMGDKTGTPLAVTCTFASKEGDLRLDLVGVRRANNRPLHLLSVIFLKRQLQAAAGH